MRVPTVGDIQYLLRQVVMAMQNRLTALDNFGPEGEAGQVLTSNGPDLAPTYQDAIGSDINLEPYALRTDLAEYYTQGQVDDLLDEKLDDTGILMNVQVLNQNVTIPPGYNARVWGPFSIAAGRVLTVSESSVLVIE